MRATYTLSFSAHLTVHVLTTGTFAGT